MDLWIVAVVAGAAYLGKYLQNLSSSEKERLLGSSSTNSTHIPTESWNFLQQYRDRTCPLRRLVQERAYREVFSEQKEAMHQYGSDPDSVFERASTSGKVRMEENFNVQWLTSSPPRFRGNENFLLDMEFLDTCTRPACRFCKNKLLQSRSSRETNLEKMEDYMHRSLPAPPTSTVWPLLGSDGNQVMGKSNRNSIDLRSNVVEDPPRRRPFHSSLNLWSNASEQTLRRRSSRNVLDSWPNVGEGTSRSNGYIDERCTCFSPSSVKNMNFLELQEHVTGSEERMIDGAFHSSGHPNDMLLFLIGLTIGIIPAAAANKREVKELNEKLEQATALVQDLQEELDMKDNLTVKELANDGSQSLSTKTPSLFNQKLILSSSEETSCVRKMSNYEMAENSQLMSRIEAELEAELERLELNMDQERTSDFVKLDSHPEVNLIEEGIELDAIRRQYGNASESEFDEESDTTTGRVDTPPADYAVCPRELNIRLHEVMESRLQARIKELETALQNNQNRFRSLESQCITSISPEFDNGESPSTPVSHDQLSANAMDKVEWDQLSENAIDTAEDACGIKS